MLPLDEQPFEINANTRAITVPDNFKRHGISVQGDEIAETLFFRIARYFDAVDFDTCRIFVQWEGPEGIQYITPINIKDVDSQEGYMLFAWPLSSTLTKMPGPIKFSVRFIKQLVDNDEVAGESEIPVGANKNHIVYSYSTLTATAVINPGLDYDIFDTLKDTPDVLFAKAIENSTATSGIKAAKPVFDPNLPGNGIVPEQMYLVEQPDGTMALLLEVQANAEDTGLISYKWYYSQKNTIGSEIGTGKDEYKLTEDTVPNPNKTYYEEETMLDNAPYRPIYDTSSGAFIEGVPAYERFNTFTITGDGSKSVTGLYFVTATNRLGKSTTTADSYVIELPTAVEPTISTDLVPAVIEDAQEGAELKVAYTAHTHAINKHDWQRTLKKDKEDSFESLFENPVADAEYNAKLPGYYRVNVISEVNLDTASKMSAVARVTNLPEAPAFADEFAAEVDGVKNPSKSFDYLTMNEFIPEMKFIPGDEKSDAQIKTYPADLLSDEITYTWVISNESGVKFKEDGTLADVDAQGYNAVYADYKDKPTPALMMSPAIDNLQLRCVATNKLNGKLANSQSRLFVFF